MAFNVTQWKYSDEVAEERKDERIPVEEGDRYLFIEDASCVDDVYQISVRDLGNEATFNLRYWLNTTDKEGNIIKNFSTRATLIALGEALAGAPIGIPAPQDIIGGVVLGEVKMSKPNTSGKSFPRIYKFEPVPEDMAALADIDQYYLGDE